MDASQILALAIFALTIGAVVANVIDSTLAALLGVAAMIWLGVMSEQDAFGYVDWNVMSILVSIWLIAGYFGKVGGAQLALGAGAQALGRAAGLPGDDPELGDSSFIAF